MIDVSYPGSAGRADDRSWGPGWPTDRSRDVVSLVARGVDFGPGVRPEIRDLVVLLIEASFERGYLNRLIPGSCFSYANRAIKQSDGSLTDTPSNHSWGVAVDINASENVYGSSQHAIPAAMGALWNRYGFRWGGDYPNTKDWMHFEFMGTPGEALQMRQLAEDELMKDDRLDDFVAGFSAYWEQAERQGDDPGPPNVNKPAFYKRGWEVARKGARFPIGGSPTGGPFAAKTHSHKLSGTAK